MTDKTGGPAFPCQVPDQFEGYLFDGMRLRDYFAAKAMQGILARTHRDATPLSRECYAKEVK